MARPAVEFEAMLKGLEAADAFTFQVQKQATVHEQAIFHFLHLQIILQRLGNLDDSVQCVDVQFPDRQFALHTDIMRLQVAQIYDQRHKTPNYAGLGLNLPARAARTCAGTKALTSPPSCAISLTIRELRKV